MAKKQEETPLMAQYNAIKAKYPDAMLLFRVGDFYETFGADAVECSRILGIILTKRNVGYASQSELAGFPHHALDTYLPKLVLAGKRVAVCDQLEDPKMTKTIVKRGVTELVTPGVALNDTVLNAGSNNFLASVHYKNAGSNIGVAFMDISTGEFFISEGNEDYVEKLLANFNPSEVLFQRQNRKTFFERFDNKYSYFMLEDWVYTYQYASETLMKHFSVTNFKGFGVEGMNDGLSAAGAIMYYLSETQHDKLGHVRGISRIIDTDFVWMDRFTVRNLEIISSTNPDAVTLLDVMDHTVSPMGARLFKRWLLFPLKDSKAVNKRLDTVEYFVKDSEQAKAVRGHIGSMSDMERIAAKIATGRINPKEINALAASLQAVAPIADVLASSKNESLSELAKTLDKGEEAIELIRYTLREDAPSLLSKGEVIAEGVNANLDELREMLAHNREHLTRLTEREIEKTGITSLKIAFNNVFGYYIEVRNTHKDKVPADWIRKQTTVSAERYITPELKEYEQKILGAEENIARIESEEYQKLVAALSKHIAQIQDNAKAVASLDCLLSFATLAVDSGYCRPAVDDSFELEIIEGRHPVIEKRMKEGEMYVSNNVTLNRTSQQIIMITGPNMSGKSALLRQTALITLMAQIGSYVPARSARIGVVDKIFTRVGASDNISSGESTFMVEMNETASILNNLSERSLIVLDEIGRGTSTYDGISIAWAITEFIHQHPGKAKTLFATHYHELNEMSELYERIKNYNVSVREIEGKIIFMRKLEAGGSNHSFGIHVAQMAGMPRTVVERASSMLEKLEQSHRADSFSTGELKIKGAKKTKTKASASGVDNIQLSFFQLDDPTLLDIKEQLQGVDINALTPVEALVKLEAIKKRITS